MSKCGMRRTGSLRRARLAVGLAKRGLGMTKLARQAVLREMTKRCRQVTAEVERSSS